jgi:cytochrome bd-type quinol oxidase subunit 2
MTTAPRLPDAFTTSRTSVAAATPTCSCCCCAISATSASIALPAVFNEGVRKQQDTMSRDRRDGVALCLAALPWLLLIVPLVLPSSATHWLFAEGGRRVALAAVITTVITAILATLGGSRTPWLIAGHFTLWAGIAAVESFLILATLRFYGLFIFTVPIYFFLLFRIPRKILERTAPK